MLARNYRALRRFLPPQVKIMGVVKADAYGAGAVEIARALEALGIDALAVGCAGEGIELRAAGLSLPILLLAGHNAGEEEAIVKYQLTPACYDLSLLAKLSAEGERCGRRIPFHLKLDTGMGRLGIPYTEAAAFARAAARLAGVTLAGVFSHLSSADEAESEFTELQIQRFKQAVGEIRAEGIDPGLLHLANSAGLARYPSAWLDMVRPGIILYGFVPGGRVRAPEVEPILSLKTRIAFIKTVPAGTPIGYNRRHITRRESRIAVLPIGYADGLNRALSDRGLVIIGGQYAPIIGAISMDLTTVDVTDLPAARVGDEAIVLGKSGSLSITAADHAALVGTIPYEILCAISKRVPRIYRRSEQAADAALGEK